MPEEALISNSYTNNEELLKKFPVKNPTPVHGKFEHDIQNRLLNGFENWNRGFAAWKAWGNILYTNESIYNVHGARLTLAEYQTAMNVVLARTRIDMGEFRNMIICGHWCAIHYDIFTKVGDHTIPASVMEFVDFKDYGPELGVRVKEGWGGAKDAGFDGMCHFQGEDEKKVQQEQFASLFDYVIPETSDLEKKYPILNPSEDDSEFSAEIHKIILKDFDSWNQGYKHWKENAEKIFAPDVLCLLPTGEKLDFKKYCKAMETRMKAAKIEKKYFDSFLISEEWAAIHYRYVKIDAASGEKTPWDGMEFYKFKKVDDVLKIAEIWTK